MFTKQQFIYNCEELLFHGISQKLPAFHHRPVAVGGEDDVVKDLDSEEDPGAADAVGDFKVVRGGFEVARGVIVGQDDGGGPFLQGVGEDFAGVDERAVDEPDGHDVEADHLVGAVEHDDDEMLLLAASVVAHLIEDGGICVSIVLSCVFLYSSNLSNCLK